LVSAEVSSGVPGREEIIRLLIDAGAVRFGDFTLASGEKSDVYIDVKRAWPDPRHLKTLTRALIARAGTEPRLAGMELGAVPLVVAVALATGRPYAILRKSAKEHGTRQAFEGEILPGEHVLLIEDVTTTGGSTLRSIEIVRAAGGVVERALVVLDREAGAVDRLGSVGVRLESLVTFSELRSARA
jgi:orotate phosphoribosyltransferase